jgi:uncharacterized 2Fe-2S/4Fe-4S cluster protein (DUF4445 family)
MSLLKKIQISFPLLEKKITIDSGKTVAEACALIGFPQNLVCGGKGTCKKCLVTIRENQELSEVLSCQHLVSDQMEILISKESVLSQILETSNQTSLPFDPEIKVYSLPLNELEPEMCSYDLEIIRKKLNVKFEISSIPLLKKLSHVIHNPTSKLLNIITNNNEIIDLIPNDIPLLPYGVAFDIGTTSVVGYLYNLSSGVLINQYSSLNKQISFGADVISRIDFASNSQENLEKLQTSIISTINIILNKLSTLSHIPLNQIYSSIFCGNSTMSHLFFGLNPVNLGLSPFVGISKDQITVKASSLKLDINPVGNVSFLPLLGGFVGADTTAVLLGLPRDASYRLMIDLGTNGEIAVGNQNRYFVSSTACGPALEGAGIHMGMRGTDGAIEKISYLNNEIVCQVIGNTSPIGFCGSGIVDVIAFLYREGLIYSKGNFIKNKDLDDHPLKNRFSIDPDGQRYFIIVTKEDNPNGTEIIITQKDIRQVQLAKAAIYTGCSLLTKKFGINPTELKEIVLAGAFGNYIDVKNAQFIGLIPEIKNVPIRSIGNGAGTGVQLYLLSKEEVEICNHIPEITTHIELATDPNFSHAYMMNTAIGQNEIQ